MDRGGTETDMRVLEAFNYHINENKKFDINTIAKECDVATSTVTHVAKKLGYSGFTEMRESLLVEADSDIGENFIPSNIVDGDVLDYSGQMAEMIYRHRYDKNVIINSLNAWERILSGYFSRKLSMFNVFSPNTYDYATVVPHHSKVGFAVFFEHRSVERIGSVTESMVPSERFVSLAKQYGYEILLIGDAGSHTFTRSQATLFVPISSHEAPGAELFVPRVVALIEFALSDLAELFKGEGSDFGEAAPAGADAEEELA